MKQFQRLHKILSVLLVFTMLFGSVPALAGTTITIDGTTETSDTGYSNTQYVGVDGTKPTETPGQIGANVDRIETIGTGVDNNVWGIKVTGNNSVTATSITNGIAVNSTNGEAYGIYEDTGTTTVSNLGDIEAKASSYAVGIAAYGDSLTAGFKSSGGYISVTSTNSDAYGIDATGGNINATVTNIKGITANANNDSYGLFIYCFGNCMNASFTGAGSYINATSTGGKAYGMYSFGTGTDGYVSNLGDIETEATNSSFGMYMGGGNSMNASFTGAGSCINATSTGGNAYGMYSVGTGTDRYVSNLEEIEAKGSSYGIGMYMDGGSSMNASFTGAGSCINATSTGGSAYGMYSVGTGTDRYVANLEKIEAKAYSGATGIAALGSSSLTTDFESTGGYINVTSTNSDAYGIDAYSTGNATVTNLKGITANASANSYGLEKYGGSSINVSFTGAGSYINATSTNGITYGIYANSTGTGNVSNLGSISANTLEVYKNAYGIYSNGSDTDFANNVSFAGTGSYINATSAGGEAYGIAAYGIGTTTVSNLGGIEANGSSYSAYSAYGVYTKKNSDTNITFSGIGSYINAISTDDDAFGISAGGSGKTEVTGLESIQVICGKSAVGIEAGSSEGTTVTFTGEGKINVSGAAAAGIVLAGDNDFNYINNIGAITAESSGMDSGNVAGGIFSSFNLTTSELTFKDGNSGIKVNSTGAAAAVGILTAGDFSTTSISNVGGIVAESAATDVAGILTSGGASAEMAGEVLPSYLGKTMNVSVSFAEGKGVTANSTAANAYGVHNGEYYFAGLAEQLSGYGWLEVSNLAGITANASGTSGNATGIYSNGSADGISTTDPELAARETLKTTVNFAGTNPTIKATSTNGEAYGIAAYGIGTTTVTGLGGIEANAGDKARGIYTNGSDADMKTTVEFAGAGKIEVSSSSTENGANGIWANGKGQTTVSNVGSINAKSAVIACGIFSNLSDTSSGLDVTFTGADSKIITTGPEGAPSCGIVAEGCGTTKISQLGKIEANGNGGDVFGIFSNGSDANNFKAEISFSGTGSNINATSTDEGGEAYGIYASGKGKTAVSNLGGIEANGSAIAYGILSCGSDATGFENNVSFKGNGGQAITAKAATAANAYSIYAAGKGATTVNFENSILSGKIHQQDTATLTLNFDKDSTWKVGEVEGTVNVNTSGTIDFSKAVTFKGKTTLNTGSILAFHLDGFAKGSTIVDSTANPISLAKTTVQLWQEQTPVLTKGDTLTLLKGATDYTAKEMATMHKGQGVKAYKYSTYLDSASLMAEYLGDGGGTPEAVKEAKSLSEGFLAGATALIQANDLASDTAITSAKTATETAEGKGYVPYAAIQGAYGRYNTGSHIDLNSTQVAAGLAKRFNDKTVGGFFIEGGNGRYTSYNEFEGAADVRADGDINYFGAGIFARHAFNKTDKGNAYIDAAFGAGHTNQDYATDNIGGVTNYRYDTSAAYLKAHATFGYEWQLAKGKLDSYVKYLWTRQNGDTIQFNGADVNFDAINSNRLRAGARYTQSIKKTLAWYGGLAYEYEFSAKAGANSQGLAIAEPDLIGSSGMAELGLKFTPETAKGWLFDLGVQGFTGKRDSLGVRLGAWYEF